MHSSEQETLDYVLEVLTVWLCRAVGLQHSSLALLLSCVTMHVAELFLTCSSTVTFLIALCCSAHGLAAVCRHGTVGDRSSTPHSGCTRLVLVGSITRGIQFDSSAQGKCQQGQAVPSMQHLAKGHRRQTAAQILHCKGPFSP